MALLLRSTSDARVASSAGKVVRLRPQGHPIRSRVLSPLLGTHGGRAINAGSGDGGEVRGGGGQRSRVTRSLRRSPTGGDSHSGPLTSGSSGSTNGRRMVCRTVATRTIG